MTPRGVELRLTVDADGVRSAAEAARDLLGEVCGEAAFACELSVAEACANVVEHSGSGVLRVVMRRREGVFSVAVCDRGTPFAPPATPGMPAPEVEAGRGIALMVACMDRIRVVRSGDENRLLMARRVAPEAA